MVPLSNNTRRPRTVKLVDKLSAVFTCVDNLMGADLEKDEKETLRRELEQWQEEQDGLVKELAELLKKHLVGKETTVEEEEETVQLKTPKARRRKTVQFAASHDETPVMLHRRAFLSCRATRSDLPRAILRHNPVQDEMPAPSSSASHLNTAFLSPRASQSDPAQTIPRQNPVLDESVVCLGFFQRPEVITLDTSAETTPAKPVVSFTDLVKFRRSAPMVLSSPQSPWPAAADV